MKIALDEKPVVTSIWSTKICTSCQNELDEKIEDQRIFIGFLVNILLLQHACFSLNVLPETGLQICIYGAN